MKLFALITCFIITATTVAQDTERVKEINAQIQAVQEQYNHTLMRLDELRQIGELERRKVQLEDTFRRLSQMKAEAEKDTLKTPK